MRLGIPRERVAGERRVALAPDTAGRLVKAGHTVVVERDAGRSAGHPDAAYEAVGATVGDAAGVWSAEVVAKVQRPEPDEVAGMAPGTVLVCLLAPATSATLIEQLAARGATAFAMELVPRITRAQPMDALSSQATIAGYKAVLVGAAALPRILPMLTTAAGTLAPARVFVVGAGVAGLQAIATARRLGAVVSGLDVRPAAQEQIRSLGATAVELPAIADTGRGGYAGELDAEQTARVLAAIGGHLPDQDLVITTAQVPGRAAPRLVTAEMVATMRPGSVLVDLASDTGGNCALTQPGETVDVGGVTIIGATNLAATVPLHASLTYGRNVHAFLEHLLKDGQLAIDLTDEIAGAMCVTHAGAVRYGRI
jgi:NAD(P) transhydrogenase subunit alpha